ncbi:hypothetical protein RHMOL_Rhmol02G0125400 [Rhododendron molle]|uniref:Uncharacterized protein n=1 Tax=Rhododendron molle TaxID=49168 RepID=A0ACC0PPS3_RHOML|nr:hypothetical protein RHMOL_Rhmol02G0125400 [Rhododendron molle]
MNEAGNSNGNSGRRRAHIDDDDDDYEIDDRVHKSKNLDAERRRRKKLNDRLLELRSLMNKGTIVTDAITYIEELEKSSTDLRNQLLEMGATVVEESKLPIEAIDGAEEMKNWGIEPEIKVNQIDRNKLWIKMVFEKKRGGFTKLVEAVSVIGYEFTDTSVTTSSGAILVSACLELSPTRPLFSSGKEYYVEEPPDSPGRNSPALVLGPSSPNKPLIQNPSQAISLPNPSTDLSPHITPSPLPLTNPNKSVSNSNLPTTVDLSSIFDKLMCLKRKSPPPSPSNTPPPPKIHKTINSGQALSFPVPDTPSIVPEVLGPSFQPGNSSLPHRSGVSAGNRKSITRRAPLGRRKSLLNEVPITSSFQQNQQDLLAFPIETNGSENVDLMAPVAANGPYDKAVIRLKDELVPSPAPSSGGNDSGDGGAPAGNRLLTRRHSSHKSAAGGDVILGGFATALVAAIFCYIRVTRRNQQIKTAESSVHNAY